ncbi:mannose-1-phosphate guanylyltransferase/mannose-6-phosphate isomerase [bacterium]|nr:mannose-1-phosphate guanylyltransferase/mannose-6-phosphate isomerase [bacterium]
MYSLILAGGSGSRLWPLSRELYPKQLLNLNMEQSLLQSTFQRLACFTPSENIISITNAKHVSNVKYQLQDMCKKPIVLAEPIGKNTAPAIAVATKYIKTVSKENDPVILVVPSDHLIKNLAAFKTTVMRGEKLAKEGYIVTFGIQPSYPETGYGYINVENEKLLDGFKVKQFVEKPDAVTAQKYIDEGSYYWNSGIFMFKVSTFLNELQNTNKEIFDNLNNFDFSKSIEIPYVQFNKMPSISVDYAVMEKSNKIALVKLESDWNDLGSRQAIYDVSEKDSNGNVFVGNILDEGSKNSFAYSSSKLVSTIGLEDTVVVETEDAILVCKTDNTQDVKLIYERLKKINDDTHKVHKTVYRPWGFYTVISSGNGYLTKKIHVNPHQKLSLQSHNHRAEHWVVALGVATVRKGDETLTLQVGQSVDIAVGEKHSLQNLSDNDVEIIELQQGSILLEEDIIRYEDMYGRV